MTTLWLSVYLPPCNLAICTSSRLYSEDKCLKVNRSCWFKCKRDMTEQWYGLGWSLRDKRQGFVGNLQERVKSDQIEASAAKYSTFFRKPWMLRSHSTCQHQWCGGSDDVNYLTVLQSRQSNAIIIAIKPISYVEMNEWMMNDLFSSVFTNSSFFALFVCFKPFHSI